MHTHILHKSTQKYFSYYKQTKLMVILAVCKRPWYCISTCEGILQGHAGLGFIPHSIRNSKQQGVKAQVHSCDKFSPNIFFCPVLVVYLGQAI